mmetsp:Transcript_42974/g.85114  ORF Transcript_42974/g.85114 Transcript_42974/m.85114 type:complete len:226 (-) Transcript_42974:649-1326(-)
MEASGTLLRIMLESNSNLASSRRAMQSFCPRRTTSEPESSAWEASNRAPLSSFTTCRCRKLRHAESMAFLLLAIISAGVSDSCTSWFESSLVRRAATSLQPEHNRRLASLPNSFLNSERTVCSSCSGSFAASACRRLANSMWPSSPSCSCFDAPPFLLSLPEFIFFMAFLMMSFAFRMSGSLSFSSSAAIRASSRSCRFVPSSSGLAPSASLPPNIFSIASFSMA